jgi:hypothetical protein
MGHHADRLYRSLEDLMQIGLASEYQAGRYVGAVLSQYS